LFEQKVGQESAAEQMLCIHYIAKESSQPTKKMEQMQLMATENYAKDKEF